MVLVSGFLLYLFSASDERIKLFFCFAGSAGSQSHIQDKTNIVFHSSCIFWKAFGQMPSNLESYRTESNLNKASEIQMFVKSQKFPKVVFDSIMNFLRELGHFY